MLSLQEVSGFSFVSEVPVRLYVHCFEKDRVLLPFYRLQIKSVQILPCVCVCVFACVRPCVCLSVCVPVCMSLCLFSLTPLMARVIPFV